MKYLGTVEQNGIATQITQITTTETIVEMKPNVFYNFGEIASELSITLATPETTKTVSKYMGQFSTGENTPVVSFPAAVQWANEPTFSANKTYQFSIVNNIGLIIVNGQPISGGGADWNAKEGEAGYIENKPFRELHEDLFSFQANNGSFSYNDSFGKQIILNKKIYYIDYYGTTYSFMFVNSGNYINSTGLSIDSCGLSITIQNGTVNVGGSSDPSKYTGEYTVKVFRKEIEKIDQKFLKLNSYGDPNGSTDDNTVKEGIYSINNVNRTQNLILVLNDSNANDCHHFTCSAWIYNTAMKIQCSINGSLKRTFVHTNLTSFTSGILLKVNADVLIDSYGRCHAYIYFNDISNSYDVQ